MVYNVIGNATRQKRASSPHDGTEESVRKSLAHDFQACLWVAGSQSAKPPIAVMTQWAERLQTRRDTQMHIVHLVVLLLEGVAALLGIVYYTIGISERIAARKERLKNGGASK